LLIGQASERRHLTAGDAFANGVKQIAVFVAVGEAAGVERGTAIAAAGRRVTRRARLVVDARPFSDRHGVVAERVAGRVRLLGQQQLHAGQRGNQEPNRLHRADDIANRRRTGQGDRDSGSAPQFEGMSN
jgi:hypothetical protein